MEKPAMVVRVAVFIAAVATPATSLQPIGGSHDRFMHGRDVWWSKKKINMLAVDTPTQTWDVESYQQRHSFVWEYGASFVDRIHFTPDLRILDVGCGTGELTDTLYHRSYTANAAHYDDQSTSSPCVLGMDSDQKMINKARDQFPHIHFFVGDVRNFEFKEEEQVDLIFSNAALHWVPPKDAHRAVRAMARALKPGGQFVVEFGGRGNVDTVVQALLHVTGTPTSPWYFPSISEFTSLLEQDGNDIEVENACLFNRPTPLDCEEDGMRNWLLMFGSKFFEGMSEAETEKALDGICDMVRPNLYAEENQQWVADYVRIQVVGRKKARKSAMECGNHI